MEPASERRHSPRTAALCKLSAREVLSTGMHGQDSQLIEGEVRDLSEGGCCVRSEKSCPEFTLLRGRISTPDLAIGIPTLMQVRWSRPDPQQGFLLGLNFLLE